MNADEAGTSDIAIVDSVSSLIDKSLVQRVTSSSLLDGSSTPRFAMLETIRDYALEQLAAHGEQDAGGSRHAAYFLARVETAASQLSGPEQARWIGQLDADHGNLRAALNWSLVEANSIELGLRLVGTLWPFWEFRGYLNEGRRWLAQAVQATETSASIAEDRAGLANALRGSGVLAQRQGDYPAALNFLDRSLTLYRNLRDERGLAMTLNDLGRVA